jgi:transcriptional regulator with XRE-family HTH domain
MPCDYSSFVAVNKTSYDNYLKELGENIRRIRKMRKITMESLSFGAEIEYRLLGRIERGEGNTTVISLLKIANVLKVDVQELFNFKSNNDL